MATGNKSINATLTSGNVEILAAVNAKEKEELAANVSSEINNVLYDYMTSLVLLKWEPIKTSVRLNANQGSKKLTDKIEEHKQELEELFFKVLRCFAKENNDDQKNGVFAFVEAQCELQGQNLRSKGMFIAGFDQFIESKAVFDQFFKGKPLSYGFVLEKMLQLYMPIEDEGYDLALVDYQAAWEEADYVLLRLYRETVIEAFAYKDDTMVEYATFDKRTTILAFQKQTGMKWQQENGSNEKKQVGKELSANEMILWPCKE